MGGPGPGSARVGGVSSVGPAAHAASCGVASRPSLGPCGTACPTRLRRQAGSSSWWPRLRALLDLSGANRPSRCSRNADLPLPGGTAADLHVKETSALRHALPPRGPWGQPPAGLRELRPLGAVRVVAGRRRPWRASGRPEERRGGLRCGPWRASAAPPRLGRPATPSRLTPGSASGRGGGSRCCRSASCCRPLSGRCRRCSPCWCRGSRR